MARVPLQVSPRAAGTSKWGSAALIRYAVRNLVSFTSARRRLVAWIGLMTLLLDGLLGVQTF